MTAAVAYIRRSASEESPVSEDAQRETVARLAAEHGHTLEHVYRDWGRSGGAEDRPQYLALLDRLEAGGVEAVYAYDQDRLARSNWLFAGLLRLAGLHGFAVETPAGNLADERHLDFAELRGVMDGAELRKITKRNKAIAKACKARGDDPGTAPYGYMVAPREKRSSEPKRFVPNPDEPTAPILDAYERAGTLSGAAVILNREGVPSKHGKHWDHRTVRAVVERERPELVQDVTPGRRREHRPRLFAGLLRCHCGGPMSPGRADVDLYYCGRGKRGHHDGQKSISEARLRPWIEAEASRLAVPHDILESDAPDDTDDAPDRAAIAALRAAGRDEMADALAADLEARRSERAGRQTIVQAIPPAIDWEWSTEALNAALRALWEYVELGPDLLPVRAEWTVPEWREDW